ncbi:hypothetical protein [uncultured Methanospirillum sp.]|uniref:hypothetical protein n=1 Tax=uncultured Methanospirillum sp. TaxID=262503 RepID=UPI0029C8040D|nr:hypothetical protein [uncultured Methanospirillum sp.]
MEKLHGLEEAQSYLDQMQKVCNQPDEFDSSIHAFYRATQAILEEISQEVETKPWRIWYKNSLETSPVFAFFADERNLAYHVTTQMVPSQANGEEPNRNTATDSPSGISSFIIWIKQLLSPDETSQPDRNTQPPEREMNSFYFDTWPGKERALSICRRYLYEINQIVQEGQNLAYIS